MKQLTSRRWRSRAWYATAFIATIAVGLASRSLPPQAQALVGKYPGDALWALMVFFGLGALCRTWPTLHLTALTFAFSTLIEVLKLYQEPWAVAVRQTTLGHLVFGHVFSWQNLVAYAVGALAGLLIELAHARNLERRRGHLVGQADRVVGMRRRRL